jgi:hypothetical protein
MIEYVGKSLSELSISQLDKLVVFLDIDETLGRYISIEESDIEQTHMSIEELEQLNTPLDRLIGFEEIHKTLYKFGYYNKFLNNWRRISIKFRFRYIIDDLLDFFRKNNMKNIYLFSAAADEYVIAIKTIIEIYYDFTVIGYKSVNTLGRQIILLKDVPELYMEKDMNKFMIEHNIPSDKIPILLDDRPHWGQNGLVIPIKIVHKQLVENIEHSEELEKLENGEIFLNTPIELFKKPIMFMF